MLFARLALMLLAAVVLLPADTAFARKPEIFTGIVRGVAVGGYDPVAYFNEGRPVQGRAEIKLNHAGAEWRFANEANRDLFKADPVRYAPQFGGHCSYAAARGYTASGDPKAWKVVNGKLYLNYSPEVKKEWERDQSNEIRKANANWPSLLDK